VVVVTAALIPFHLQGRSPPTKRIPVEYRSAIQCPSLRVVKWWTGIHLMKGSNWGACCLHLSPADELSLDLLWYKQLPSSHGVLHLRDYIPFPIDGLTRCSSPFPR